MLDANSTSGLAKALLLAAGLTACEGCDVVDPRNSMFDATAMIHNIIAFTRRLSRSQRQSLSYEEAP